MITGQVNAHQQAVIPIKVYDVNRQLAELTATIDTGFTGYVTLPAARFTQLQLAYDRTETYTLGNNDVDFDLYRATLSWDGQGRDVFVLSTESEPLIGMSSLRGYTLFIDVIDGGEVRIAARP
jgi:clan AA aspartic protease